MAEYRAVAGLGNPGKRYQGTRHNVGFEVLDAFSSALEKSSGTHPRWIERVDVSFTEVDFQGTEILLIKPLGYMNRSGEVIERLFSRRGLAAEDLLVIHDEVDLDFGTIRLKKGGGEAGHNGLRSISTALGSRDYSRLRVGVGRSEFEDSMTEWVLGKFRPEERKILGDVVSGAVEAVIESLEKGLGSAQRRFNKFCVKSE